MSFPLLLLAKSLKLMAEIALLCLAGQAVLGWLAGPGREGNAVYRLLRLLTAPLQRLVRRLSPRLVPDRHVPLATGALLLSLWLAASALKISLCLQIGLAACR